MIVQLRGVRGSIPTPLETEDYHKRLQDILGRAVRDLPQNADDSLIETFIQKLPPSLQRVTGGNTTCITIEVEGRSSPIILDCGTGLRTLGDELLQGPCGQGEGELSIFLSHTHWDHIQGIPFFKPLYIKGNRVHFYSVLPDLEERLQCQQKDRFFPIDFTEMAAEKIFHVIKSGPKGEMDFGNGLRVDFLDLRHPGGSTAMRFRNSEDATFIFATDAEFTGEDLPRLSSYDYFFRDADLLVIDAQYALNESFSKFDWGHTSNTMAVNCGVAWKIKNLVLTHHEPGYNDEILNRNFIMAQEHKDQLKSSLPELILAREGLRLKVGP